MPLYAIIEPMPVLPGIYQGKDDIIMIICGLQKTTLLDYPGHVAATIFLGNCNFRCPFCHNKEVVSLSSQWLESNSISEDELFRFLQTRRGILHGVCITGGEPTVQQGLEDFIRRIREMGYQIKLDTNGYRPETINQLLNCQLLDYIAMDIKSSPARYPQVCGTAHLDIERIRASVSLIQSSGISYEFRTTVAREFQTEEDFREIGLWLSGSAAYYLQPYRDCETLSGRHFHPYTKEEMDAFVSLLQKFIPNSCLRGI